MSAIGCQMEVGPLIGSGILSYTLPVISAHAEPTALGTYSKYTTSAHPHTQKIIEGWRWDERVWSAENVENTAMFVPANWDPSISGITSSYFQSGIGSNRDLRLESIQHIPSSGVNQAGVFNVWSPEINHGYYYDFSTQDYLFSDDSEITSITYSGIVQQNDVVASGFNEVTLSGRPKVGIPIKVRQLEWNSQTGKYDIALDLKKKVYFTGVRDDSGARLTTYIAVREEHVWANVDKILNEFIVSYSGVLPKVILNKQYSEEVGSGVVPSGLEFLGYADGSANQQFHTQFAPVDESTGVNVYSYIVTSGTITEWDTVGFDVTLSGNQIKVDYDLGILEFGDGSLATQNTPVAGASIGINYRKTVFVEYEPDHTQDTITATEASVNPIYRRSARGFVYLATQLEDPASITLAASLTEIQANIFGPLAIGNSFSPVIATVKDSKGQLLEGQTVQFFITSTPSAGTFGTTVSTTASTNEYGEAKAFYNPPRSVADIGEEVTASGWLEVTSPTEPEYSGLSKITKLHTEKLLIEGDLSDIFLYEVHVDDPLQGFMDVTLDQNNADVQLSGYYSGFFNEHDIQGATRDIEWEDMHRMTWNLSRPTLYATNTGLGRKKLVSQVDSTAINPYTFTAGAVAPVQPINVEDSGSGEYDVVFNTSALSMIKPSGSDTVPSGTLYSYFIVAPTTVSLQASVFNSRLNQTILSNEISIKLSIPSYLSGQWIMNAINQNHIDEISTLLASGITASGQRVPLGFRLRSSTITLAAALDGVTFLDINRPWNYDPYDPDTVSGVRLGHKFTVTT